MPKEHLIINPMILWFKKKTNVVRWLLFVRFTLIECLWNGRNSFLSMLKLSRGENFDFFLFLKLWFRYLLNVLTNLGFTATGGAWWAYIAIVWMQCTSFAAAMQWMHSEWNPNWKFWCSSRYLPTGMNHHQNTLDIDLLEEKKREKNQWNGLQVVLCLQGKNYIDEDLYIRFNIYWACTWIQWAIFGRINHSMYIK